MGSQAIKKFHLVNWNQVTNSKNHGGLGITEPKLMNIAMGARLLWRLVAGNMAWGKQALWKKYFWLEAHGLFNLSDLSTWSNDGSWNRWTNLCPPSHLTPLFNVFKLYLLLARMCPTKSKIKRCTWMGQRTVYS